MRVDEFAIDEVNEEKFERHGVTVQEVLQVLQAGEFRMFRNKGRRRENAEYVVIGTTLGGRFLTIPVDAMPIPGQWRPRTAWESSEAEQTRYNQ
jgi:hypothetical protein